VEIAEKVESFALLLVEDTSLLCAILHLERLDDFWIRFLSSMEASFPLLPRLLILENPESSGDARAALISGDPSNDAVFAMVESHLRALGRRDKRGCQRFDWPVQGTLRWGGLCLEGMKVRAVGCCGVFLEAVGVTPAPGTKAMLSIKFEDFSVLVDCEVLPARPASANLPAGFGVRFSGLSEPTRNLLDRFVKDGLVRRLMAPEDTVQQPSLESPLPRDSS
jgi:hypothetical protein